MSDTPQLLLAYHLKALKLPTFLRENDKLAQQCAAEGGDHPRYLLRLAELELIDRERRMVERRIREARFPTVKSLDSFDFTAIPSLKRHWSGNSPAANTLLAARTQSRSATAALARRTLLSDWGWRPVRRACRSASPPRPPWCTS
jgi:DNA replication protein DnaC